MDLSSARNAGIDYKGEYISFVDSDDWIEPDMYEQLFSIIVEYDVLLAMGGRYDVYENSLTDKKRFTYAERTLLSTEQLLPKMLLGQGCDSTAWDKLYHKSLWEEIRFPEGENFEDIATIYRAVIEAKRIAVCDEPFYNYLHRSGSITTSPFTFAYVDYPKHTRKMLKEIMRIYPYLEKYAVYSHIPYLCAYDCHKQAKPYRRLLF